MILFTPSIGLDVSLLDRLAASIDFPVKAVAYNNGPEDALEKFSEEHPDWFVMDSPTGNKGVADTWNECAKLFPDEDAWIVVNEDAHFLPGYLEQLVKAIERNLDAPLVHLNPSNAFYCFGLTKSGLQKFGTFDANFFPAYLEDNDMRIRHRLSGITTYPYALEGQIPMPHGKPRTGGVNYNAMLQGCGLLNRAYFFRKWGSYNFEGAGYSTPYKDHRLTVKDWIYDPKHRAELFPLWRSFMEQNPSIYD